MTPYLRIQIDESDLEKELKQMEKKLDQHEKMILDLQRLIKDMSLQNNIMKEIQDKTSELEKRIDLIENNLNSKIKDLEGKYEGRLLDTANMINKANKERFDSIKDLIPNSHKKEDINDKLKFLEDTVHKNGAKLNSTRAHLQAIASSISLFNDTFANLDETLPNVLNASVTSVKKTLKHISDCIRALKKQKKPPPEVIQNVESPQNIDLSSYQPYPSISADWRDSPRLPPIDKFENIGEVVDYIYKLIPNLQAHLFAIHDKIISDNSEISNKADKSLVEKMFEKFQSIIGELNGKFDELKDYLEQTATREEINDIIKELTLNNENQTSVGRLKCIACGRDIPQVTGATTEEEAQRLLGPPPNSILMNSRVTNSTGLQFQSMDGFDSAIIETPRSIRPFRSTARITRTTKSLVRHK
ncbi:hypothetical protein GPJ56_006781 [Histomonas meleagridis]|uniref:uncharacterized protein n=1 Tax=Histomonas meleagridis TaxID=135588 RepID=UPI00355AAF5F|nr:hypothetical protein GPJ56_006781 [Histomonas meleagridis]KAH0802176.1 hypothetical protein GO595_005035 [Histomonas meleagridis]